MQSYARFPELIELIEAKKYPEGLEKARVLDETYPHAGLRVWLEAAAGKSWEQIPISSGFDRYDYLGAAEQSVVLFIALVQSGWEPAAQLAEYRKALVQYLSVIGDYIQPKPTPNATEPPVSQLSETEQAQALKLRDWLQYLIGLMDDLGILGSKANLAFIKTQFTISVLPNAKHELAPDMLQAARAYESVSIPEQAAGFFEGLVTDFGFLLEGKYQRWVSEQPIPQQFVLLHCLGEAYNGLMRLGKQADREADFNRKLGKITEKIEHIRQKAQIEVAVGVFLEHPNADWNEIFEKIVQATGCSAAVGLNLFRFIPIAYCRQLLPEVRYPQVFLTPDSEGEFTIENKFEDSVLYQQVWAYAQKPLNGDVMRILKHSVDFQVINQALHDGVRLEEMVLGACLFY